MLFRLRQLMEKDAPLMLEWMHDDDVTQFLSVDFSTKTLSDAQLFIRESISNTCKEIHMACVNEHDEYLGTVSLKTVDLLNKRAEYAICMRRCAHGTGAAFYATEVILRIAFEQMGLERVYLYHYSSNRRARRFYQKMGFIIEGVLRHHVFRNGVFEDEIWYGILRNDWANRNENDI